METSSIRMRVKEKDGAIWLRALIEHPMETGLRKDNSTGMTIPAHYISDVVVESNGEMVFTADWSTSISQNPFLLIKFWGSAGDKVKLTWTDNMGNSDSLERAIGHK